MRCSLMVLRPCPRASDSLATPVRCTQIYDDQRLVARAMVLGKMPSQEVGPTLYKGDKIIFHRCVICQDQLRAGGRARDRLTEPLSACHV